MRPGRQSTIRRVLASVMLAALTLSFAASSAGAGWVAAQGCPPAPANQSRGPALVAAMPDGMCEHLAAGPCLATLGCVTVAPAIALVPTLLVVPNSVIVLAARPAPHFGDLFRTGPPTPPPNQI